MEKIKSNPGTKDGLLWQFIAEKLGGYTAPSRKGIPRGEQVGYQYDKYQAALVNALMGASLKEIAERFDISYALLRRWATESEFKELGLKFREEFTERFIRHFRSRYEDNSKQWNEHSDEEVKKVLNRPDSPEQRQRELQEVGLQHGGWIYGPALLADIYNRIQVEISEGGTSATFFWLNLMNMLFSSSNRRSHDIFRTVHYALLRYLSISQIQQTKAILHSPEKVPPKDRLSAIRSLNEVQKFLEWPQTN